MDAQEGEDSFAVRGDGALVIFDREGYFLLITDKEGTIWLQGSDGHRETVYCEPVWITGYYEIVHRLPAPVPLQLGDTQTT